MDQKLLFLINREWTHPAFDRVMAAASAFEIWLLPMIALVLLVWLRGGFRGRAFLLVAALAVGVNDGLISKTLKRLADRPRPHQALTGVRMLDLAKARFRPMALFQPLKIKASRAAEEDVDGRSFPSSHTMNTSAVALVCALFFRRGWLAFVPALLVGYSRVYTGSHWPSDVFTSIVLAAGATLLFVAALELLWRRFGARILPQIRDLHPSLIASRGAA
jgi:undecaprenyl-diphosphatase